MEKSLQLTRVQNLEEQKLPTKSVNIYNQYQVSLSVFNIPNIICISNAEFTGSFFKLGRV